jgi:hypothetical protein
VTRLALTAVFRQAMRTRRDSIIPSRLRGPLASKGGMGRVLRVEIVVLATLTPILPVRCRHLEDRDLCLLHEAQQPRAIAAGRLYSDALQLSKGSHPGEHLAIALPSGGEGSCFHDPILFVDNRCDVHILVGVEARLWRPKTIRDDRYSPFALIGVHTD